MTNDGEPILAGLEDYAWAKFQAGQDLTPAEQVEVAWMIHDGVTVDDDILIAAGLFGSDAESFGKPVANRVAEESKLPWSERERPQVEHKGTPRYMSGIRTERDAARELTSEQAQSYLEGKHYLRRGVPPKRREQKRRVTLPRSSGRMP